MATNGRENGASPLNGDRNGHLLTVSEAAAVINAHPNSVRRWADMGLLPSLRIGLRGDRRFSAEDVDLFLGSFERYQRKAKPEVA